MAWREGVLLSRASPFSRTANTSPRGRPAAWPAMRVGWWWGTGP